MAGQITHHPPFEVPLLLKKFNRWAERKVPDDYSDGDMRHWPGGAPYRPSADEYYRCILGQAWAEKDGVAQAGVHYYIDKLPDGYAMFEMNQPGGPQTYRRLFGHPSSRFYDSAARFIPHFLWLMSGMEGDCECIYCARRNKAFVPRKTRTPREMTDTSSFVNRTAVYYLTDDDNDSHSSRASPTARGLAMKRTQRQRNQAGTPHAVDEEGTEDVYKDCVKKLENARGSTRGVEIDLTEDGSIDWKAERKSLPQYLTQIEQQHSFVPRIGELVLWCPSFLDEHYLMLDPQTSEHKFYSFEQECFHGFPAWRGGVVTAVPCANIKNGTIDFPDILDTPEKKTAFNTAGFRIETMPDPNDDMNKSMSKQYRYVPLRNIRPLAHWQVLLKGISEEKLHSSISYALTCMTSTSLLEKWRFNGSWPTASVFCKGIYLGSELIVVGDAIRLAPLSSSGNDLEPEVMIVDTIRYNLLSMQPEHVKSDTASLCGRSYISFVGAAYTRNLSKVKKSHSLTGMDALSAPRPLSKSELKTVFSSVGAEEYGQWYLWHGPKQKYEVSHEKVIGRLYEADAVRLWTGQRQYETTAKIETTPELYFDVDSVMTGRLYATATDARLPEPQSETTINWFLADTRAEALAVATFNGIDVGKYHEVRTAPTLKQWRMQVKIADGQQIISEIADEYIKDLSTLQLYTGARRGRPPGSKVVDGKLIKPNQQRANNSRDDISEERPKPSSQMAGAALATDHEGSSEEYYSYEMEDSEAEGRLDPSRPISQADASNQSRSALSKADIMGSIEVPEDGIFDADVSDEEPWWENPPPIIRGDTEESEGGDYRE